MVEGVETWVREEPGEGTPVVFWHGNPTDSGDWAPFLERLERPSIAPDLPAFGRSGAPDKSAFDYSMDAYGHWASALLDELCVERYSIVVHDWGAIGLLPALAHPERVESIVVFNAVPFGVSYRWHLIARMIWQRRGVGELGNAITPGRLVGLAAGQARPGLRGLPRDYRSRMSENWARKETRDAVLALYRSAPTAKLDEAGEGLERLGAPALFLWATRDPYIGVEDGRRMAARMPGATFEKVENAGHWPWIDRPDLIDRAVEFLS